MKLKIKSLTIAFISFYVIYEPLRVILETGDVFRILADFKNILSVLGLLTTLLYLYTYSFGAYWVFFKTYTKERRYIAFALLPVVALAAIFLRYFLEEVMGPALFGVRNYAPGTSLARYLFDNLYFAFVYLSLGIVFFFVQYTQYKEVQQRELIFQSQKTELTLLRSQLNPHFLFNILNNIYSLIYYKSDNALKSVEKLSGLLRYALYEKAEKVSVKKEMGYLHDFIDLHKMRLDFEPAIDFKVASEVLSLKIAPFLLIPFVENAFKHGELKKNNTPISISALKEGDYFSFTVGNTKKRQEKDEVGGIGIQNVRKRLELLYGSHSDLQIRETPTHYTIQLKIALSAC